MAGQLHHSTARDHPEGLLGEPFSLGELQELYEAVAGARLAKDPFRRTMQTHLVPTGELSEGRVGKPARLWRRP